MIRGRFCDHLGIHLATGLRRAAGHRHQKGEYKYQILHHPAKIQNYKQLLHLAARLLEIIKTIHTDF
jgi:hypothetical protein